MLPDTKARAIKLILLDVDGVLTDGKILLHADGTESKQFDIKDGTAIVWAQRAAQLGVAIVHQGVTSKLDAYEEILRAEHLEDEHVAYMGDDVLDLPVLMRAGFSAAPADADADVRSRVDLVTSRRGGDGAVRELIDAVLRAQGRWDPILSAYVAPGERA